MRKTKLKNTDHRRRRRDAVWGVCLFSLLQIIAAVVCFWVSTLPELMGWCVVLVRIIGVSSLLFILPALLVLKQRFQEIEGGELDEAGKY